MKFWLFILLLLLSRPVLSQYTNQWVLRGPGMPGFNPTEGLDFNQGNIDTTSFNCYIDFFINGTNICDNDGKLLFVTNGQSVANTKNTLLVNGDTLKETYLPQLGIDMTGVPQATCILTANAPSKFTLLHMDGHYIDINFQEAPWLTYDAQPLHVYANAIDMSYNNGQGRIDSTFAIVTDTLIEGQLTATRHANGRDWWVVTHKYASNLYYITRIGQDLQFETHTQAIGPEPSVYDPAGQACFSPDGSKYCLAVLKGGKKQNVSPQDNSVSIFDFDRCTGTFSNLREQVIPYNYVIHGCQFSPNGEYLYVTCGNAVFQYDLAQDELLKINALDTLAEGNLWLMQLAPDGNIYIGTGLNPINYLTAITDPNEKGDSCKLITRYLFLNYNVYAVPTFPNYSLSALDNSACDTLGLAVEESSTPFGDQGAGLVKVYPNPATNQVSINAEVKGKWQLTDALGRVVVEQQIEQGTTTIATEQLDAGVYYYVFATSQKVQQYGKLVKQ